MPANRFLLPAVAAVLLLPSAAMGFSASSVSGAMEDTAERESAAAESAAGTAQSNGAARGGDSAAEAEDPAPAPERAAAPAPASGSNGAQPAPSSRAKDSGKDRAEGDAASGSDLSEDELADSLRDAVIEYAEGEYEQLPDRASYDSLEITVPRLDGRRIKSDCGESLQMELSKDAERAPRTNTVRVRCTLPGKSWRLPVQIRITKFKRAVVASADIERDEVLSEGNLRESLTDITKIKGGAFDSIAAISGSRAKRRFSAGDPVPSGSYCAVCRNDEVTLEAGNAVLTISTAGTALEDGSVGSEVRVRNGKSGKTVSGRVLAPGRVRTGSR